VHGGHWTLCGDPQSGRQSGRCRWQVLTWNASGYGPWSDTRSFLVEIADPTAVAPEALSRLERLSPLTSHMNGPRLPER